LQKRLLEDPLASLSGFNEKTDRRHVRRVMTREELAYLLPVVEGFTTANHNLPGADRAMLYRLAFGTGFRASELRSLTSASFDLDTDPPTVTVGASYSKRRREDAQPIRRDLAELLRPWLTGRPRNQRLFERLPGNTARMLRTDLAAARIRWIEEAETPAEQSTRKVSDFLAYVDGDGRVCDFHATRHTYISGIVSGGASVKVAQELARHSTGMLTVDRYAHTRLHDL
jgi:integrase